MRKITEEDFKNTRTLKAQYKGNSRHLVKNEWYNVRYMEKRKYVSVPLSDNPHIGKSNQGIEFGLSSFYIEE